MTKYVGVSSTSLLGIAFVVLKLTKVIDWSWLWVLSPFWIPWSIFLFFLVVLVVCKTIERKL